MLDNRVWRACKILPYRSYQRGHELGKRHGMNLWKWMRRNLVVEWHYPTKEENPIVRLIVVHKPTICVLDDLFEIPVPTNIMRVLHAILSIKLTKQLQGRFCYRLPVANISMISTRASRNLTPSRRRSRSIATHFSGVGCIASSHSSYKFF